MHDFRQTFILKKKWKLIRPLQFFTDNIRMCFNTSIYRVSERIFTLNNGIFKEYMSISNVKFQSEILTKAKPKS